MQRDDGIGGARTSACGTVERKCDAKEEAIGVGEEATGVGEEATGVGEEATMDEGGERNVTPRGAEAEEPESLHSSDKSARLSTAAVRTGAAGIRAVGRFLTRRMRERRQ